MKIRHRIRALLFIATVVTIIVVASNPLPWEESLKFALCIFLVAFLLAVIGQSATGDPLAIVWILLGNPPDCEMPTDAKPSDKQPLLSTIPRSRSIREKLFSRFIADLFLGMKNALRGKDANGNAIRFISRNVLLYNSGDHSMEIVIMAATKTFPERRILADTISKWTPPFDRELVPEATKMRIFNDVRDYLSRKKIPFVIDNPQSWMNV